MYNFNYTEVALKEYSNFLIQNSLILGTKIIFVMNFFDINLMA
jgi:hypothetical protein